MINKYISIPIEVEAVQFKIENVSEVVILSGCSNFQIMKKGDIYNCLITVDGVKLLVIEGNYVIKNKDGKISVLTEDIFNKNYIKKE